MAEDEHSDPLRLFSSWQAIASSSHSLAHPDAVCVSTADEHGVPDARFVDLKAVSEAGFVFCTHLDSVKARSLAVNPNAALTFWWDHIERQVRVLGRAERITDSEADLFFERRSRDAQIASWGSNQSATLADPAEFEEYLRKLQQRFANVAVPRPEHWGGYCVVPSRVEFLTFKANRIHQRLVYQRKDGSWLQYRLQP